MSSTARQAGMSLPELLIAALIGLGITLASLQLYQQSQRSYRTTETLADLEERAAFALRALTDDIALAGFWGRHASGPAVTVPASIAVRCNSVDVTGWALQLDQPVAAANASLVMPCPAFSAAVAGADSLVIRHASSAPATPRAGRVQLATRFASGALFADGVVPGAFATDSAVHDVEVHAWYVDRTSSTAGLPSLRRYALVTNSLMQNQEMMPGIEDLQVTLGVDRNGDGYVDGFVNPDRAGSSPIMAVRVWLQVRALQREPGLGSRLLPPGIDENAQPLAVNDDFRRITAERTVFAPNLTYAAGP